MSMTKIVLNITVRCAICKVALDAEYDSNRERLDVTPCEVCLKAEHDEGRAEGRLENEA